MISMLQTAIQKIRVNKVKLVDYRVVATLLLSTWRGNDGG